MPPPLVVLLVLLPLGCPLRDVVTPQELERVFGNKADVDGRHGPLLHVPGICSDTVALQGREVVFCVRAERGKGGGEERGRDDG